MTQTDSPRRVTRRTALKTLAGATALAGGLATQSVAVNDDSMPTNVRLSSPTKKFSWTIDKHDVYRSREGSSEPTKVATYRDATLMTPVEEPSCDWAGGEEVGTFWEADSGAAVVIVTGEVARMRRTAFRPTYVFAERYVLRAGGPDTSLVIEATTEDTNLTTVNALTKAVVALILDGECGFTDQSTTTTTTTTTP